MKSSGDSSLTTDEVNQITADVIAKRPCSIPHGDGLYQLIKRDIAAHPQYEIAMPVDIHTGPTTNWCNQYGGDTCRDGVSDANVGDLTRLKVGGKYHYKGEEVHVVRFNDKDPNDVGVIIKYRGKNKNVSPKSLKEIGDTPPPAPEPVDPVLPPDKVSGPWKPEYQTKLPSFLLHPHGAKVREQILAKAAEAEKYQKDMMTAREAYHEAIKTGGDNPEKMRTAQAEYYAISDKALAAETAAKIAAHEALKVDKGVKFKTAARDYGAKRAEEFVASITAASKKPIELEYNIRGGRAQHTTKTDWRTGKHTEVIRIPRGDTRAGVHELGHALESQHGWYMEAKRFLDSRVGYEKHSKIRGREVGWKDDFEKAFGSEGHYVGRKYSHASTEIISMGLEKLYKDPVTLAKKDPEYFDFMVNLLHGKLKR